MKGKTNTILKFGYIHWQPWLPAATQGTTRLPSPSRTIGMNLSLGDDDDEAIAVGAIAVVDLLHVMDEEGELLPGVDG